MRTHTFFGLCDELQARNREAGLGRWGGGEPATGIRLVRQEPSILIGVVCDLTCLDFRQNTHKIRQARLADRSNSRPGRKNGDMVIASTHARSPRRGSRHSASLTDLHVLC